MTRDEQLIYEGYKDILKKALPGALGIAVGAGAVGTYHGIKNKSKRDKIENASSIYRDNIIVGKEPISIAAKVFVDITSDLPRDDYLDLKDELEQFTDNLPEERHRERAEKLQHEIDFQIKQIHLNRWADKDEDAEKVATEPYLNTANDEEILTQYKQSWQAAGGGYGKGYMQQD